MSILYRIRSFGGSRQEIVQNVDSPVAISPDGKTVAFLSRNSSESLNKLSFISIETGSLINSFPIPFGIASPDRVPVLRWTADGKSVTYIVTRNDVSNIWQQPLAGGEAKPLTDFSSERIFSFDWSKDDKQIIYSRGVLRNNLVLIENF